jgi:hypothetical protein
MKQAKSLSQVGLHRVPAAANAYRYCERNKLAILIGFYAGFTTFP